MASGDLSNQVPIIPAGFVKDSIIGGMPDSQQRHWIPDERDAFISWLRGEFAAANAIIDTLCHHLQMIGKPGEYDFVLTCIQQRRYNWTVVLHMQQYFSVAEVVFALQQVVWFKQALNSDPSGLQPMFGSPENGGGPPWKEGPIIYRDPRGESSAPGAPFGVGMQHSSSVPDELYARKEALEVPRSKSEEQVDRRRNDSGDQERQQQQQQAVVSSSPDSAVVHPSKTQVDLTVQATATGSGTRTDSSSSGASSSPASIPVSSQGISEPKEEKVSSDQGSHERGDCDGSSSTRLEGPDERVSTPYFHIASKEEDDKRQASVKITKSYSCLEHIDGKLVNAVDGLELHEKVLDKVESSRLTALIQGIRAQGKRGELGGSTFMGSKKGVKGKGRELLQFGHPHHHLLEDHKKRSFPKEDYVHPVPPFLEAIIDRLVRWHIIPAGKRPDYCSINMMEEGDYLPPHLDNSHLERPYCILTLQSECTLILGQSLTTSNTAGDYKGPLQISLPVGSVLVLQRNSADIARHNIPASPGKRIFITLGKFLSNKLARGHSQSAGNSQSPPLPAPMPSTSWGPSFNHNANSRQGNNTSGQHNSSGRTGGGSGPFKSHKYPPASSGGVLPNPTARPATIIPAVTNSVPPLFSGTPGPPAGGSFPSPSMSIPSWAPVPRPPPPNRPPSAGTGVFFPSSGASSGPGRPVNNAGQRRSASTPPTAPILQKTNSAPASFASMEAAAVAAVASPSTPPAMSSKPTSIPASSERMVPPAAARVSPGPDTNVPVGKVLSKEPSYLQSEANGVKVGKEDNLVRNSGRASKSIAGNSRTSVVSSGGHS